MIKYMAVLLCVFMSACDESVIDKKIIISGQSNAEYCDWSYFEGISGYDVVMIAKAGYTIQNLIDDYHLNQYETSGMDMIFVHGERDAILETDPSQYISKVHEYQNLTGVNNIYFSLVGYKSDMDKDWSFDVIRRAVKEEASNIDYWHIGYGDALTFRDRKMLRDNIHFTEQGCREMILSINLAIQ